MRLTVIGTGYLGAAPAACMALDPAGPAGLTARPRIIDGRGSLDGARWAAAGWDLHAPGRPARPRQERP